MTPSFPHVIIVDSLLPKEHIQTHVLSGGNFPLFWMRLLLCLQEAPGTTPLVLWWSGLSIDI